MRSPSIVLALLLLTTAAPLVDSASAQLLYSFEGSVEGWTPSTIVGDADDNTSLLSSVPGVGNTQGNDSLQVESRGGDYVRSTAVSMDASRLADWNAAAASGNSKLEFDLTVVPSEISSSANNLWVQMAFNGDASGWTQVDLQASNGFEEWVRGGPDTVSYAIPLSSFGSGAPGFNGGGFSGTDTSMQLLVATAASDTADDRRTFYLDNLRVSPIPEPTSCLLGMIAAIGGLLISRRCR